MHARYLVSNTGDSVFRPLKNYYYWISQFWSLKFTTILVKKNTGVYWWHWLEYVWLRLRPLVSIYFLWHNITQSTNWVLLILPAPVWAFGSIPLDSFDRWRHGRTSHGREVAPPLCCSSAPELTFVFIFFGETTFIDSYFGEIFTGLFFLKRCCPSCPLGSFLVQRNAGSQDRWIAEERPDIGCWFDFLENKYLMV